MMLLTHIYFPLESDAVYVSTRWLKSLSSSVAIALWYNILLIIIGLVHDFVHDFIQLVLIGIT